MDRQVRATDSFSAEDHAFAAWINPLGFGELDYPFVPAGYTVVGQELPAAEDFLQFLCDAELPSDASSLTSRYREIHPAAQRLFAPPAAREILGKLIWPLRHAQASYVLGNYLGTISLCGFVAEMLAILVFDMTDVSLQGQPLDKSAQRQLFGSEFEKLGQERRERVLAVLKLIPEGCQKHFAKIREYRTKYLHYFSSSHDAIATDARETFRLAAELAAAVIGETVHDGTVRLQPTLLRYLAQHGQVAAIVDRDVEAPQP